jgi:hypothetical protein
MNTNLLTCSLFPIPFPLPCSLSPAFIACPLIYPYLASPR